MFGTDASHSFLRTTTSRDLPSLSWVTNHQSCEAPAARQYWKAFGKFDADDAVAILSSRPLFTTMPMTDPPALLKEMLIGATSAVIQIN